MAHRSEASPPDQYRWKNRVLVIVGSGDDPAVTQQQRIYRSAADGMSERQIILVDALDNSERSRQIRSSVSADGKHFHAFLIGKDGHTALASDKPFSAEYLFQRIDAMPMRQDEIRRSR